MLSVVKASRLIAKFRRLASRQLSKTADEGLIIYNSAWVLSVKKKLQNTDLTPLCD